MKYTYTLGKSLYVPLTSCSNTVTLPASRGPKFPLPAPVVAALCRVRDAEKVSLQTFLQKKKKDNDNDKGNDTSLGPAHKWKAWCAWLDLQDESYALPPSDYAAVPPETMLEYFQQHYASAASPHNSPPLEEELVLYPTVSELMDEIITTTTIESTNVSMESIVIAGEGEPLLRLPCLLTLLEQITNTTMLDSSNPKTRRLVTNGLVPSFLQSQPQGVHSSTDIPQQLRHAGLDAVSIALPTHDPSQYNDWMQPTQSKDEASAHQRVCSFVQASLEAGLAVEVTAVDRPGVDATATEALAKELGVTEPVRWRFYFP